MNNNNTIFIPIPRHLILSDSLDEKRIIVACYCFLRSGYDSKLILNLEHLIRWSGFKPNTRKGEINDKFKDTLLYLRKEGYISFHDDELSHASCMEIYVYKERYTYNKESDDYRFARLFLYELNKILSYDSYENKNNTINKSILLLLFVFIRMNIWNRTKDTFYDEYYLSFIKNIAEEIHICSKIVSKGLDILKDLNILYYETMPRWKYEKEQWHTGEIVLCNAYDINESNITFKFDKQYCSEIINNYKIKLDNKGD